MQVFISWSGVQSHAVAKLLRAWLPLVLANKVVPFVSSEDIDAGDRGLNVIADELEKSNYGLVVVTPSNQHSAWINFEAGAIGRSVSTGKVAPILLGLSDANLVGPLKQFQNTAASDREAVLALVQSINSKTPDPLPKETVETLFAARWGEFMEGVKTAADLDLSQPVKPRDTADLLDEVLTTVRSLQRDVSRLQSNVRHGNTFSNLRENHRDSRTALVDNVAAALIQNMIRTAGGESFLQRFDGRNMEIELSEETPMLGAELLRDLQRVVRSQRIGLSITRSDGTSVFYDSMGNETRGHRKSSVHSEQIEDSQIADVEADNDFEMAVDGGVEK